MGRKWVDSRPAGSGLRSTIADLQHYSLAECNLVIPGHTAVLLRETYTDATRSIRAYSKPSSSDTRGF